MGRAKTLEELAEGLKREIAKLESTLSEKRRQLEEIQAAIDKKKTEDLIRRIENSGKSIDEIYKFLNE